MRYCGSTILIVSYFYLLLGQNFKRLNELVESTIDVDKKPRLDVASRRRVDRSHGFETEARFEFFAIFRDRLKAAFFITQPVHYRVTRFLMSPLFCSHPLHLRSRCRRRRRCQLGQNLGTDASSAADALQHKVTISYTN